MKAVAIYARVSSEGQAQRATIQSQIAALQQRVAQDGHRMQPDALFADDGISGATLIRPALERLRDRVANGEFDLLYVHSPDRLARKYAYQVLVLEELSARGVEVVFLNTAPAKTAEDQLLLQVQGVIAEYERAKITERCRRGRLHKAREGRINCFSGAPYGYLYIPKNGSLDARFEISLPQAKTVRHIFEWMALEQLSIRRVCERLQARGIPTAKGRETWSTNAIYGMIKNPAYMGKAAFNKTESKQSGAALRLVKGRPAIAKRPKSSRTHRATSEWISVEVTPLVSEKLWTAANDQLAKNQKFSPRNANVDRYLLQGLTVCAHCHFALVGQTSTDALKSYSYYRHDRARTNKPLCATRPVRAEQLEELVWQSVLGVLAQPQRLLAEWQRRSSSGVSTQWAAEQRDAQRLLTQQENTLRRLYDAYEAGALDLAELQVRAAPTKQRIKSAGDDIQRLTMLLGQNIELKEIVARVEDFASRVDRGLKACTWQQRQQLVRALIARIELSETNVNIVYRVPGSAPTSPGETLTLPSTTPETNTHKSKTCGLRSDSSVR
jgi:site-specific DNA recombinase